jgi:very-short-patch-repair endonuclease
MNLNDVTKKWLEIEYSKRSFADIAKELGTYANAVRRLAIKLGIKPKDKSEAQAQALKSGRHGHPTKGRERSAKERIAISEGVAKSWKNLTEDEYNERVEQGRQQWANMTKTERDRLQTLAMEAVRKASREGSQLEKFIAETLKSAGFLIEFHKKRFLANDALELDLFLPERNIAIEIDGPTHFLPIWGEDALRKTIKADKEKNAFLISYGVSVIRVKQLKKNLSAKDMRDIGIAIQKAIVGLETARKDSRVGTVITVEVNDGR